MDAYFLLGNPVEHSLSPAIHARFAQLTGQRLSYEKKTVPLDGLPAALAALQASGALGCNITVPFKAQAFAAATYASAAAQLALAANTLLFKNGGMDADNTDGTGLVRDIERNAARPLAGLDVLLIGAGGAAAGVLGPLLAAAPRRLVLTNRSHEKAQVLVQRHQAQLPHAQLLNAHSLQKTELLAQEIKGLEGNFDVIINATASSLAGAPVPVPHHVLKPGALAYDMMYGPAAHPFMQWAHSHHAVPRDGLGMLVEQAAQAFYLWRGVHPPAAQVLHELRATMPGPVF